MNDDETVRKRERQRKRENVETNLSPVQQSNHDAVYL
jgi:hypothetical protein